MPAPTTAPRDTEVPGDAALVSAYRAGDEEAAAALVRRHSDAVARFLYASGAERDDLDDLLQETFYRAFRKLDGWRGDSFRSWLMTIAANLHRDAARQRKRRVVLSIEDRELAAADDPHGELTASEAEERLRAGIAALPRLQREVFLLRVQEGADYDAIAGRLGTTPGAARVHYHQAIKRLKELAK